MRKTFLIGAIALLQVFSVFVFFYKNEAILVSSQRTTGPDLIVIKGQNKLKKSFEKFKVNYFDEVYSDYNYDSQIGFSKIEESYMKYSVIGTFKENNESTLYGKVHVISIYSKNLIDSILWIDLAIILLSFLWLIGYILKRKRSKNVLEN